MKGKNISNDTNINKFIDPINVDDIDDDVEVGVDIRKFTGINNNPRSSVGLTPSSRPVNAFFNNKSTLEHSISLPTLNTKQHSINLDEDESPTRLKESDIVKIVEYLHQTHHPALHHPKKISPTTRFIEDIKHLFGDIIKWRLLLRFSHLRKLWIV